MSSQKKSHGDAKDAIPVQGSESEQKLMSWSCISYLIHFSLEFFPVSLVSQHFSRMI
jgi:hypothetical protein